MFNLITKSGAYLGTFGSLVDAQKHLRKHYRVDASNSRHYLAVDKEKRFYRLKGNMHGKGFVFVRVNAGDIAPFLDDIIKDLAEVQYRQEVWRA